MQVPCHFLWIPWLYAIAQWPNNGSEQSTNHSWLAQTLESLRYPVFRWFCEFLPLFHLWIFKDCLATHSANPKGCPLALYWRVPFSFQYAQKGLHYCSSPDSLDSRHTDHSWDWCLRLCPHSCTIHYDSLGWVAPGCFTLLNIPDHGMQLWQGVVCYLQSLLTMATLPWRFQYDYWHHYWSPKPSILLHNQDPHVLAS